jgi:hypothetical protein
MQTEAEKQLRIRVLLALQVALFGEVRPSLRGVAAAWDRSSIRVRMLYDGPFGEDEVESASMVETELVASFHPEHEVEVVAQRLDYPAPLNDVGDVDAWVYRRWEPLRD